MNMTKPRQTCFSGRSTWKWKNLNRRTPGFQDSVNNFPRAYDSFTALSALVDAGQPVNELQRGIIDYNMQKYALAVDAFNRYIKSTEQPDPSALYLSALSLREMEQYEEANPEFDEVIQKAAGTEYFLKAWKEKAYTQWAYVDRYQDAAETMLSFVRLYPADSNAPDFLFEAGRIYERGEMFQQAIETWERIINEYPNLLPILPGTFPVWDHPLSDE